MTSTKSMPGVMTFVATLTFYTLISSVITLWTPSPAHAGTTASARELITLLNVPTTLEQTIYSALEEAKADMLKRGQPEKTVTDVTEKLKAEMIASMPALLDEISFLYARTFTQVELEELIKFYQSKTGQKLINAQSSLQGAQSTILHDWLNDVRERTKNSLANA